MNTFGRQFRLTSFGESHSNAIGGVIDGCPAGLRIDMGRLAADLSRRRGSVAAGATARAENDTIEWLSGVVDGVSLGTPIAFAVHNGDCRSGDYDVLRQAFRPGHADFTYQCRYGLRDHRGGGRASARETVARVVAGAIAKQLLASHGITITTQCTPESTSGNVGGRVDCLIEGVPAGLGEPLFGKLNAQLAAAMMSIPSAIAFEMGAGVAATTMTGADYADQWLPPTDCGEVASKGAHPQLTATNHCGGIQGGISNGMPIAFATTFHAVTTQPDGMDCLTHDGRIEHIVIGGRHDRYHVPRAAVVVEAMAAMVMEDNLLASRQTQALDDTAEHP